MLIVEAFAFVLLEDRKLNAIYRNKFALRQTKSHGGEYINLYKGLATLKITPKSDFKSKRALLRAIKNTYIAGR